MEELVECQLESIILIWICLSSFLVFFWWVFVFVFLFSLMWEFLKCQNKKKGFGKWRKRWITKTPGSFLRNVLNLNSLQSEPFSFERLCRTMATRDGIDKLGSSLFCPLILMDAFLEQETSLEAKLRILLNLVWR